MKGPEKDIFSAKNFSIFVKDVVLIWEDKDSNCWAFILTLKGGFIVFIGCLYSSLICFKISLLVAPRNPASKWPYLPARPAIWTISFTVIFLLDTPSNFVSVVKRIVFIGRFKPIAIASVAIKIWLLFSLNFLASSRRTSGERFPYITDTV